MFWRFSTAVKPLLKVACTLIQEDRRYYIPKPESAIQTTSTACDGEIDENDEVDDEEINPPARKRTNLEESNDELPAKATKSSHHLYSNPLDDSILNKHLLSILV